MATTEEGRDEPLRDISPEGDIFFVVGPEEVRLRVQSHCLRAASPVFNAMFGPNYKEGQDLSSERPKIVRLEEDDAAAMQVLCCIIHHQHSGIPLKATSGEALRLASASDKYGCGELVKHTISQWCQMPLQLADQAYFVAATSIIRDPNMFQSLTEGLMFKFKDSYVEFLKDPELDLYLPSEFFCRSQLTSRPEPSRQNRTDQEDTLAQNRHCALAKLRDLVVENISGCCVCEEGMNKRARFKRLVAKYRPTAMLRTSVHDMAEDLKLAAYVDPLAPKRCARINGVHPKDITQESDINEILGQASISLQMLREMIADSLRSAEGRCRKEKR